MDSKILHTLEYRKILNTLSLYTQTEMGKHNAENLIPISDLEEVKNLLSGTDQAVNVDRLKGIPSFSGIVDIRSAVKRARIGGTLSPHELLSIHNTVHTARRLKRLLDGMQEEIQMDKLIFLSEQLSEQKPLEDAIKLCIDDSAEVLDSASANLSQIRRELRTGSPELERSSIR